MNAVNKTSVLCELQKQPIASKSIFQVVNKQKVALGFDQAASQYNTLATIQREIADYGLLLLENMGGDKHANKAENLLDIGCGTANASKRLFGIAEHVTGVDISFNMLQQANIVNCAQEYTRFNGINGDAESLPFRSNSIDTIYSSMAMQWCESPKQVLAEVYRILKPKGRAVLCILTGESFGNLQNAWHQIGIPSRVNKFQSQHDWLRASEGFPWSIKNHSKRFMSYHENVIDMLDSIKRIGANTKIADPIGIKGLVSSHKTKTYMGKQEIKALSCYLKSCNSNTRLLALDYHLIFLEINK